MKKKVLFLGDSLTAGEIGSAYIRYVDNDFDIVNRGLNGDDVRGALLRLNGIVNRGGLNGVDTVVVQIGINDIICFGYEFQDGSFENNYEQILKIVSKAGCDIITVGLTLVEIPGFDMSLLDKGCAIIEKLTKQYNGTYIDILSKLTEAAKTDGSMTIDGCHFGWEAARILGEAVNDVLKGERNV